MSEPTNRKGDGIPVTRKCAKCKSCKPLTSLAFEPRPSRVPGAPLTYRGVCRECRKERLFKAKRGIESLRQTRSMRVCNRRDGLDKYERGPKPCSECSSLPWRVIGHSCQECGLEYAEEAPVELVLYRSNPRVLW